MVQSTRDPSERNNTPSYMECVRTKLSVITLMFTFLNCIKLKKHISFLFGMHFARLTEFGP